MKIQLKKYLIQEGVTDFVKNNWGKGMLAAGGIMLADAGAFGPTAEKAVNAGGNALNTFLKDAGDWSKSAVEKMDAKYNPNHDNNTSNHNTNTNQNNTSLESKITDYNAPGAPARPGAETAENIKNGITNAFKNGPADSSMRQD